VALVRKLLAEATTPPRWPMYPRQFKQFLKNAQPDFDERKYGSIADLMRACQKDGILRLERDRQGGLRVFVGGSAPRAVVPQGWGVAHRENGGNGHEPDAEPGTVRSAEGGPPENSAELRRIKSIEPTRSADLSAVASAKAEAAAGREGGPLPAADAVIEAQITQVIDQAEPPKAKRATRARKTAASPTGEKKKSATPRRKKAQ
jgi:hypothetical protein